MRDRRSNPQPRAFQHLQSDETIKTIFRLMRVTSVEGRVRKRGRVTCGDRGAALGVCSKGEELLLLTLWPRDADPLLKHQSIIFGGASVQPIPHSCHPPPAAVVAQKIQLVHVPEPELYNPLTLLSACALKSSSSSSSSRAARVEFCLSL
uniref:Uncharacterized protein n=1 Tax=Knipowitschia caucasica TaxID=637954 RepID=A0AAV2MHD6_KNICA